jgi:DNA gyrase subunit A
MTNYLATSVTTEIKNSYLEYAIASNARALPNATDGLKLSHRRILQICLENNYTADHAAVKTAKISGAVMGTLHPHGSVGPVIQNLANASDYLQPLLDLQGNQGGWSRDSRQKISNDNAASERYTESRLSKLSSALFDIPVKYLNTRSNYDATSQEICNFVPALPIALLNSQQSIGTGYASQTVAFTAANIVKALLERSNNFGLPDFAYNTNVVKDSGILDVYETGSGKIKLTGKHVVNEKERKIVVTKLATGTVEQFLDQVKVAVTSEKVTGISKIKDLSSKVIEVEIYYKKSTNAVTLIENLYRTTNLSYIYSVNNTFVTSSGYPETLTPSQLMKIWYEERAKVLTSMFTTEVTDLNKDLEIKESLTSLLSKMKEIVSLIMESETVNQALLDLMSGYKVTEIVAKALLDLSLKQLTKLSATKLATEIQELKSKIFKLNLILSNHDTLHAEIVRRASLCLPFCSSRVSEVVNVKQEPVAKPKVVRVKKFTKQENIFNKAQEHADLNKIKLPRFRGLKKASEEQLFRHLVLWLHVKNTKGVDKRKLAKMTLVDLRKILQKLQIL